MAQPPLDEPEGKPPRRGASPGARQSPGAHLNQHAPRNESGEPRRVVPKGGVALRMGEQNPVAAHLDAEQERLERTGQRPIRSFDQEVAPLLTVGDKSQVLIRCLLGPCQVDLTSGYDVYSYPTLREVGVQLLTTGYEFLRADAWMIVAQVGRRCDDAHAIYRRTLGRRDAFRERPRPVIEPRQQVVMKVDHIR